MKTPVRRQSIHSTATGDNSAIRVHLAGTEIVLMGNRTAWWPAESALLLADAHFGKAATFRKAGMPVPAGTTRQMLEELSATLTRTAARRVYVLGDFIHSSTRASRDYEGELSAWRKQHASLSVILVRGNHDRHCTEVFTKLDIQVCNNDLVVGPLTLCHDPTNPGSSPGNGPGPDFRVGGHLHPGYRMPDHGRKTLPCFWLSERFLVFPAFGCFTGLAPVALRPHDSVFAIFNGEIAKITPLPSGSLL